MNNTTGKIARTIKTIEDNNWANLSDVEEDDDYPEEDPSADQSSLLTRGEIFRTFKKAAKELGYHPYHIPSANLSHDQDRNLVKFAHQKAKELLEQMGADSITVPEVTEDTEFNKTTLTDHTGGGVIMGSDPTKSAVNNYSQMWEMENLFVVGASSFPHFSSSNPTDTVGALAYRAAEGMIKYLKNGSRLLVQKEKDKSNV